MSNWPKHPTNWDRLGPPLRPTPGVIDTMKTLIGPGLVLLLGVTPEVHAAFDQVVAVDRSADMIANVWPGNTQTKRAQQAEWTAIPFHSNMFSGVIGDYALSMVADPELIVKVQADCFKCLRTGGTVAQRVMFRPDDAITVDTLRAILQTPNPINWHAFKLMLHMCLSELHGKQIKQTQSLELFNSICPDRDAMCAITGWTREDVDTIDFYANAEQEVYAPTLAEWLSYIPADAKEVRVVETTDYDLCELSPIITYKK